MKNKAVLVFLMFFAILLPESMSLEARERTNRSDRTSRSEIHRSSSRRSYHSRPRFHSYYRNYGYGYYSGYYSGYYGRYGRYYMPATGIRFHLELVPKSEHKMVKRGIVTIDGSEQGIVDRFDSWQNGHIPVAPGNHQVSVGLEDERVFQTEAIVQPGQIIHVYLRFPPPESGK